MKKKLLIFLTNVCLACGIGGAITACKSSEAKVNLVEFPATATESVVLGDIYKANSVVMDESGNAHKLSVSVTDSKGNKVSVVNGEFLIKDIAGYTITYKAYVNDGQKKTVKLCVSDQDGPDILMQGAFGYIKVGEEIEFPNFKFKDLGGVQSSSVKLYYVSDGERELALKEENGVKSFTPTQTGKYLLRVAAKDNAGNEKKREYSFHVLDKSVVYSPIIDGIGGVIKEGGGSDTAVSYADEDKERVGAYQGAYVSLTATAAAGATLRISDTQGAGERIAALKEAGYNSVKVWVKAVPFEETMKTYTFNWLANCPTTAVTVATNEWTQVTLPMHAFEAYCGKTKNETWLMYGLFGQAGGLSEFCLGDVLADKYVLADNVIYNPVELGANGMRKEGGGNASGISYISADASRAAAYKGGYISYVRTGDAGGPANTLDFAPNDTLQKRITNLKNAGNNLVKIWIKATTNDATKTEYNVTWCASAGAPVVAVKTNEWTQISLPMSAFEKYYANESSGVGAWLVNVALGKEQVLSEFCLGEITAEKYTVAEDVIFSPTESGTAIMTRAGESVTSVISYVGADATREGDYKGGYISYVQNGTSAANTLDFVSNDTLKQRIADLKNAGNTLVKIWVKATAKETATETYTFTWCAGAGAPVVQIKANAWTQVSLPMSVFEKYYATELANAGNAWLVNVSLGTSGTLSEFCLGEITAEKYTVVENVFYDPAELGTTGMTRAGNSNTSVIAYVGEDDSREASYKGGYISYVQKGASAANTLDLVTSNTLVQRLTTLEQAGYKSFKVWVKAVAREATTETYTFTWCAGGGAPNVTVKTNEWVQVELSMAVIKSYYTTESANVNNAWLLNASLGTSGTLSELCLGRIEAVK